MDHEKMIHAQDDNYAMLMCEDQEAEDNFYPKGHVDMTGVTDDR